IKNKSPDKKDGLQWKWVKGSATTLAELGTPGTSTSYTLCVWDASVAAQPLLLSRAPAGGTCGTKPCWQTIKGGDKYKDKLLDPAGLRQVWLKWGGATRAKILVRGKGVTLPPPTLPLTPPVTVQLKNDDGVCWEARFSTPKQNLPQQFKARAD